MKRELEAATAAEDTGRVRHMEQVRRHMRSIEGVATLLDYPLLSDIGRMINSALDAALMPFDQQVELLSRLIEAMRVVAHGHMVGDGGEAGQGLMTNLEHMARAAMSARSPSRAS